jgi:thiamine-monophosphate kinase
MHQHKPSATVDEIGEKALIEDILRPLFNPSNEKNSVGDDCAAFDIPSGSLALISTDRVPADLISFRAGILDFRALGRYLGVLNLSDIAACGGMPRGLLLNCGTPGGQKVNDVLAIATGLQEIASKFGASVMGGDVTASAELSLSATVFGHVEADRMLRRRGARPGDSVFVSREIGLTPLALHYCLHRDLFGWLISDQRTRLEAQFLLITPEIELGRKLALSRNCTSCMDNTDGVAQSLSELARESDCAIFIHEEHLVLNPLVTLGAAKLNKEATAFALGPGADFSLIGTLKGSWRTERAQRQFGPNIQIIGEAMAGHGLYLRRNGRVGPLHIPGWNYFT